MVSRNFWNKKNTLSIISLQWKCLFLLDFFSPSIFLISLPVLLVTMCFEEPFSFWRSLHKFQLSAACEMISIITVEITLDHLVHDYAHQWTFYMFLQFWLDISIVLFYCIFDIKVDFWSFTALFDILLHCWHFLAPEIPQNPGQHKCLVWMDWQTTI